MNVADNMKKLAVAGLLAMMATGCTTKTYLLSPNANTAASYDGMQTFFVSGIGQEQNINAAEVCDGADKVAKVQTQTTFLNGLLGGIMQGLYTPRQIRVYCK